MHCLSATASTLDPIQRQVQKFWELEEVIRSSPVQGFSTEIKRCEEHFLKTYRREENGRFTLELPFKENVRQLGESRVMAEIRFYTMEQKIDKNKYKSGDILYWRSF
ncbi:unnamed protein product [Macrosiphum euphorbiae]|nr:unnamed protein product [Macrosiphum euphorbiae]